MLKEEAWNKTKTENTGGKKVYRTDPGSWDGEECFGIVSIVAVDIQPHCWWPTAGGGRGNSRRVVGHQECGL